MKHQFRFFFYIILFIEAILGLSQGGWENEDNFVQFGIFNDLYSWCWTFRAILIFLSFDTDISLLLFFYFCKECITFPLLGTLPQPLQSLKLNQKLRFQSHLKVYMNTIKLFCTDVRYFSDTASTALSLTSTSIYIPRQVTLLHVSCIFFKHPSLLANFWLRDGTKWQEIIPFIGIRT